MIRQRWRKLWLSQEGTRRQSLSSSGGAYLFLRAVEREQRTLTRDAQEYAPTLDTEQHPVLYHYCSTSTFLSVIQRKCLWLSDVNTMNDFGEMHWSYDRFIEAANAVMDRVGREFVELVDEVISTSQLRLLPSLCAFSTDGDVLSQWRAYADDGAGVAIGFNAKKMATLSIRIAPVEYSQEKQVEHFCTWLLATHEVYGTLPEKEKKEFIFKVGTFFSLDRAFYKNPAFSEEKEVRILRALNPGLDDDGQWTLTDNGGSGETGSRKKLEVQFRAARNGGVVSYVELPLGGLGAEAITEIVIGPRSHNNGNEVSMALSAAGFGRCAYDGPPRHTGEAFGELFSRLFSARRPYRDHRYRLRTVREARVYDELPRPRHLRRR